LKLTSVLYEKEGSIAYVTVNRPKVLNALDTPTWTDLRAAFEEAKADRSMHGVILTGAGDKAFMAGADISELGHVAAYDAEESSRFGQGVLDLIEVSASRSTVFGLALPCDREFSTGLVCLAPNCAVCAW
jgi:enoyl-CoA hydratase/carnithine racemase